MKTLDVHIANHFAGQLKQLPTGQISFTYDDNYTGPNLSVAMQRRDGLTYQGKHVLAWLSNLLPDDKNVRDGMALPNGYKGTNIFRLIADYGMDLPGAISIIPAEGITPNENGAYRPISEQDIAQRLKRLVVADRIGAKRSWMYGNERWSLAGAQTKIALHEYNGSFYECLNGAPSTVIVKPDASEIRMQSLCECVSLHLAAKCGLKAATTMFRTFGDIDAICVNRYDRIVHDINHIDVIHQEDMCQVMGVPPERKYSQEGGPSASACVKTLQSVPGTDNVIHFIDYLAFNYAIGNTDAHGKNYSILHYSKDDIRLAPLYDACSILPYVIPKETYKLAMPIGNENRLGRVSRTDITRLANACQLDPTSVIERFRNAAALVIDNIEAAVNDFNEARNIDALAAKLIPRTKALCDAIISTTQTGHHAPQTKDLFTN